MIIGFCIDTCTERGRRTVITAEAISVQKKTVRIIHRNVCRCLSRISSNGIKATRPDD
jgi:hypothetical protein